MRSTRLCGFTVTFSYVRRVPDSADTSIWRLPFSFGTGFLGDVVSFRAGFREHDGFCLFRRLYTRAVLTTRTQLTGFELFHYETGWHISPL